jgi:APA family basic amino acid/polyamine antiporter
LAANGLRKELNGFALTMVAVGACIGSGIFLTPADIASKVATPGGIMLAWFIGGLVALSGSLTFAELGNRIPGEGGVYQYLRRAYGDLIAFLYGWIILTVITSGAIAALALACARYLNYLVPLGPHGITLVAVAIISIITIIQIVGVRTGAGFSSFLTVLKIVGIAAIILAGLWFGLTMGTIPMPQDGSAAIGKGGIALALIGVFWSYGGWHHASYLAGETINPQHTIPRAMFFGTVIVTLTYLAANWAYLQVMSPAEMATSSAVAADMMDGIIPYGGQWIAVLIILSTFGTASIYTLSAPRIYFTMATNGTFFPALARVHHRFRTPHNAIFVQSGWAIMLLLFWSTFENLITYVVFMDWVFMVLAAMALFIFRRREGIDVLTYKTPFYPIMPILFIGLSLWFLFSTLYHQPEQAIAGILLCLLGIPVFKLIKKRHRQSANGPN